MRYFYILPLLIIIHSNLNAQFKVLAEGAPFEEETEGSVKILQLSDMKTILCLKNEFKIYDASHKLLKEMKFAPTFENADKSYKTHVFEIGGDLVIFMRNNENRTPSLYRVIFDMNTFTIKKEEKIGELQKIKRSAGYAMFFGGVPEPAFYIKKDPYSDNYAITLFNSLEEDRNKRIELIHFDSHHREISRAFYNSPDDKYKYMVYHDMCVLGDEKVCILAYGYNTKGNKEKDLLLAHLNKGGKNVSIDELAFSQDLNIRHAITRYNPEIKKIILLAAVTETRNSNSYSLYMTGIDPANGTLTLAINPYPLKADEKAKELFGRKSGFSGMPQELYINHDGSFTIVYEEIMVISGDRVTNTVLGNISVTTFDKTGKELSTYFIPKSQSLPQEKYKPFYLADRKDAMQYLYNGVQFKSFAYLNGTEKSYIIFNDIVRNYESAKEGKITTIQGLSECDGFAYELSGRSVLPERKMIFAPPADKKKS